MNIVDDVFFCKMYTVHIGHANINYNGVYVAMMIYSQRVHFYWGKTIFKIGGKKKILSLHGYVNFYSCFF